MKSKLDYYLISFKAYIISILSFLFKIKGNRIVVDNFLGKGYGDNSKYIIEELLKIDSRIEIIWIVRNLKENMPDSIKKVKYGSFLSMYYYATSIIWIDNVRNNIKPIKKKKQYYLQTWHGPFSSKKIEKLAEDKLSKEYVKLARRDGKICNSILSNSFIQDIQYMNYFWLKDNVEILKVGFPRNDYLINNKNNQILIDSVKKELSLPDECYLILYAPTFRDDFSIDGYKIEFKNVLNEFKKKTGKECKILVRLHPNVQKYSKCISYDNNIINVTDYSNMQDLSLICNTIISDYSSTLFDFAIQNKPAFICSLDLENYKKTRGLVEEYFNYPFPFATSNDELCKCIKSFDEKRYLNNLKEYFDKNPLYDNGNSTEEIVKILLKKLGKR